MAEKKPIETNTRVVSGMRPSGPLHLGHLRGVLNNWKTLQDQQECFFMVANYHALTSNTDIAKIEKYTRENIADWLSVGIDPERCTMFVQSKITELPELYLLLSMVTPLTWINHVPSYKEQCKKSLDSLGLMGYPVLQAADILMFKGTDVPVGPDQLPHIEIAQRIAKAANTKYGEIFPIPKAALVELATLPGTNGKKMSSSAGNAIYLTDDRKTIHDKIMTMLTDTGRKRRHDKGDPDNCPIFKYHQAFTPVPIEISLNCKVANIGCVDCKKILIDHLTSLLEPIWKVRTRITDDFVSDVLITGNEKADDVALMTMSELRECLRSQQSDWVQTSL